MILITFCTLWFFSSTFLPCWPTVNTRHYFAKRDESYIAECTPFISQGLKSVLWAYLWAVNNCFHTSTMPQATLLNSDFCICFLSCQFLPVNRWDWKHPLSKKLHMFWFQQPFFSAYSSAMITIGGFVVNLLLPLCKPGMLFTATMSL